MVSLYSILNDLMKQMLYFNRPVNCDTAPVFLTSLSSFHQVPAPVQESPVELFYHPAWDQCIRQSNEPRCAHVDAHATKQPDVNVF